MPRTETYTLNMGPQHPSTHGVLRVELELDGENIVRVRPIMGYLHRGIEKLLEARTYIQGVPFTDRLDYVSSMNNNLGYCRAVEELAGIEVPERAEYVRVIMVELNRIASHLVFIGSLAIDLGASTGMLYTFRDREDILDLFDLVCGARMTFHYIRIGGVHHDIPAEFIPKCRAFLDKVPKFMKEYEEILIGNEIFQRRLQGTSRLTPEMALAHNMTGPNLRATGLAFDLREGTVMAKFPKVLRPPKGEVYSRTESTRGELGFYMVSDGSAKPYRVHIRRPSFINMQALDDMCRGYLIGDSVAAFAAIDPLMGEVDC